MKTWDIALFQKISNYVIIANVICDKKGEGM